MLLFTLTFLWLGFKNEGRKKNVCAFSTSLNIMINFWSFNVHTSSFSFYEVEWERVSLLSAYFTLITSFKVSNMFGVFNLHFLFILIQTIKGKLVAPD